jgi:hypothetical protein
MEKFELLESSLLLELKLGRVSDFDKEGVEEVIKKSLSKKLPKLKEKYDLVKSLNELSGAERGRLEYTIPEKREFTVSAGGYSGNGYGGSTSSVSQTIVTKRVFKTVNGLLCAYYVDERSKTLQQLYVIGKSKSKGKVKAIRLFWRLHN